MLSSRWILGSAALALAAAACGSSHATSGGAESTGTATGGSAGAATTAGHGGSTTAGSGAGTTTGSGAGTTTGSGAGATTGSGGSAPACTPTAGSAVVEVDCDLLQLAVLAHDGAATDLRLTGRLFGSAGAAGCAAIDGVDILSGAVGSSLVQHLDGGLGVPFDSEEDLIAVGTAPVADITDRCQSDDPTKRFDVYGIVVSGRVDGGTFKAQCAAAASGSHWPPDLRVSCHKNVDLPLTYGDASVMSTSFMGMTLASAQLYATAPHGAGGALQTVDTTLHVIPLRSPFDPGTPIPSHDTTGWMSTITEMAPPSDPASQISFFASSNPLGSDLCPPAPMGAPGPGYVPGPVFLADATGTGQHGAFSSEVFISMCNSAATP